MIWTGPNDAPLSTKEERMAELTQEPCDHLVGIQWPEDRDLLPSPVRASERVKLGVVDEIFAFCPICGERVNTDEACSFYRRQPKL